MKNIRNTILIASIISAFVISGCSPNDDQTTIRLAISPYQDLAMMVNYDHLGLDKKYNVDLELLTLKWEEIIPSIGSVGKTVDVGFASYIEFLTKSNNLNRNSEDSILFIYPAYIFAGGGFTTFMEDFPEFTPESIQDTHRIKEFLSYRIGAQKNSMFDMAIYSLANKVKYDIDNIRLLDVAMADGILGLQSGSLDFASAGLTQRNEVEKRGGKVALSFRTMGFADITGFICKQSTLDAHREEIISMIKIWFECVDFVMSNVDENVKIATLPYLDQNASTKYTTETYKRAIGEEVFPRSVHQADSLIIAPNAHFGADKIYEDVSNYLLQNDIVTSRPIQPLFLNLIDH